MTMRVSISSAEDLADVEAVVLGGVRGALRLGVLASFMGDTERRLVGVVLAAFSAAVVDDATALLPRPLLRGVVDMMLKILI